MLNVQEKALNNCETYLCFVLTISCTTDGIIIHFKEHNFIKNVTKDDLHSKILDKMYTSLSFKGEKQHND